MKTFTILFFVFVSTIQAQVVIEGTPLSIEDGPSSALKGDMPIGTIVPVKAEVNPTDGQIKLEPQAQKKEEKIEVKQEAPVTAQASLESSEASKPFSPQKYLQFAFGYLDSSWENAEPSLNNGSVLTAFKVASDMSKNFQLGFAIEFINDRSDQNIPDSIRVVQYHLFGDIHGPLFENRLHWLGGLALSIGDYSIRKLALNASGEQVNTNISSGTIFGLIPSAGLRFYLVDQNSIDLAVEYHQYFSTPQRYIGGFAFVPRFSFQF